MQSWRLFIRALYPSRGASVLLAKQFRAATNNPTERSPKNDYLVTWIRKLIFRSQEIRPYPKTVWRLCQAARENKATNWVAGPVGLFAASHFKALVEVIVGAKEGGLPNEIVLNLLAHLEDVVVLTGREGMSYRQLVLSQKYESQKPFIKRWETDLKNVRKELREHRLAWTLDTKQTALFQKAWDERTDQTILNDPFLSIAASMDGRSDWKLADQRRIVLASLAEWLREPPPTPPEEPIGRPLTEQEKRWIYGDLLPAK